MSKRKAGPSRRDWLLGAGAITVLQAMMDSSSSALAQDSNSWEDIVKKLVGGAKPVDGKLTVDLPEIAENGNTVPLTVSVDSPMTEADHVKSVSIVSTGNPQPLVATFQFTPAAGKATVACRVRLARSQDIITVAEMSDGRFLMNRRAVKVTIGGCGG